MQQEGPRIHTFEDSLSVRACFSMTTEDTAILVGRRTYSLLRLLVRLLLRVGISSVNNDRAVPSMFSERVRTGCLQFLFLAAATSLRAELG